MTSTSETAATDPSLDDLLNAHFTGRVVRKDLTKLVKEGANVPVYVLEYLLGNYCASNDPVVMEDGLATVKRILSENYVRPDEAERVKSTIRERGSLKVIDKVTVTLNEKRDVYEALLSNLGTKGVGIGTEDSPKIREVTGWRDFGRSLRCNIFMRRGKRGRLSLSMSSIQSRCRTWTWTNCSPGGVSLPRHSGLMCCCVPAGMSRRSSMSARSGTCCAV